MELNPGFVEENFGNFVTEFHGAEFHSRSLWASSFPSELNDNTPIDAEENWICPFVNFWVPKTTGVYTSAFSY